VEAFLQQYGTQIQLFGLVLQYAYWLAMTVAAIWAVLLFKRLVDFKTGGAQPAPAAPVSADKSEVAVDEFVD
jgi:hypothetical protein